MRRHLANWMRQLERLESRQLFAVDGFSGSPETAAVLAPGEGEEAQVTDFSLLDTNVNSATYNRPVSPRDYLGQLSVWYFGHAS